MLILWALLVPVSIVFIDIGRSFFSDVRGLYLDVKDLLRFRLDRTVPKIHWPIGDFIELTPSGPLHLVLLLVGSILYVYLLGTFLGIEQIALPV
jgi:hypothetical protein